MSLLKSVRCACSVVFMLIAVCANGTTTVRTNVSLSNVQANSASWKPSISADGRYIAFGSSASNLVSGDSNNQADAFVKDLATGKVTLVSVSTANQQGQNGSGETVAVSADGRYVAFSSYANSLVPGDTGDSDVFVRDTVLNITKLVSVSSLGVKGNGNSSNPQISSNGRYISFESTADNLVSIDTNDSNDIFVRDMVTNTTVCVSVTPSGLPGNRRSGGYDLSDREHAMSADGRFIAFTSWATNLVNGDTNNDDDVFVRDMALGTTTRISVSSGGSQGDLNSFEPSISADGRYVTFFSNASSLSSGDVVNTLDLFVRDRLLNTTTRLYDQISGQSFAGIHSEISGNGRYVVFESVNPLVPHDQNDEPDIYIYDMQLGAINRVSVSSSDGEGTGTTSGGLSFCSHPSISYDGSMVAYVSSFDNLVSGDTNGYEDVFRTTITSSTNPAPTISSITPTSINWGSDAFKLTIQGSGFNRFSWVKWNSTVLPTTYNPVSQTLEAMVDSGNVALTGTSQVRVVNPPAGGGTSGYKTFSVTDLGTNGRPTAVNDSDTVEQDQSVSFDPLANDVDPDPGDMIVISSFTQAAHGYVESLGDDILFYTPNAGYLGTDSFQYTIMDTFGLTATATITISIVEATQTISGSIEFEGVITDYAPLTTMELREPGTTKVVGTPTTFVAPTGEYQIEVPAGVYDLAVKEGSFLRDVITVDIRDGSVNDANLTLIAGDIDGDNQVTYYDYALLAAAFDSSPGDANWDERADLDKDGVVSILDYSILSINYQKTGKS